MLLATSLLQQLDIQQSQVGKSRPAFHAPPEPAASLEDDEAGHRLANLLQIILRNLERTAGNDARLTISAARDQVAAARRLQTLLDGRSAIEHTAASYLRVLGDVIEELILRPSGHELVLDVASATQDHLLSARVLSGLGQLVIEAVMNAAKHAFPAGPSGKVFLKLSQANAWLVCSIIDDGVGSHGTLGRVGSRGMLLTDALAQQAGGHCGWIFGQHGTEVRITWPMRMED